MKYEKKIKKQNNLEERVKELKIENSELKKDNVKLNKELNKQRLLTNKTMLENMKLRDIIMNRCDEISS